MGLFDYYHFQGQLFQGKSLRCEADYFDLDQGALFLKMLRMNHPLYETHDRGCYIQKKSLGKVLPFNGQIVIYPESPSDDQENNYLLSIQDGFITDKKAFKNTAKNMRQYHSIVHQRFGQQAAERAIYEAIDAVNQSLL